MTTKVVPFTANNFRRFVVGSMLQTLAPSSSSAAESSSSASSNESAVAALQQRLSSKWKVQQQPFDAASTLTFYQRLGEFALGSQPLPLGVLDVLRETVAEAPPSLFNSGLSSSSSSASLSLSCDTAAGMRALLQQCGFMRPGDNLHRLVASHRIELPEAAHRFVEDHEVVERDPFDGLRVRHEHNVFAIDSITTSEVDDAIGIAPDGLITVYVADATVHCPIFSELEHFSARTLTTTTYLPEGVFFMLPERITMAATLREDRPCRTFNINFRVDPVSGELHDYSVEVGWVTALRRVTYDATQELLERRATAPLDSSPKWMTPGDVAVLQQIHEIAKLRYKAREVRAKGFTGSMPDPLIIIDKKRQHADATEPTTTTAATAGDAFDVLEVKDQIICTKDARLAVAELMIAANEVCSRVAQASKIALPFRGSRPLSSFHEAAADGELVPPSLGYSALPTVNNDSFAAASAPTSSGSKEVSFFARSLVADMEKLRGVTRAYYSHLPVYHNGLDTHHYCHSTSPLRRYPDMLVHHQLKTLIARTSKNNNSNAAGPSSEEHDFIPEADMIKLCGSCSSIQQKGKIMQMRSDRFWILRFIEKQVRTKTRTHLRCFVGATEYIRGNPETDRTQSARHCYRSDVFIPDVQLVHSLYHDREDMLVGVTATCRVAAVDPYLDRLLLEVESVVFEEDLQRKVSEMVTLIADS